MPVSPLCSVFNRVLYVLLTCKNTSVFWTTSSSDVGQTYKSHACPWATYALYSVSCAVQEHFSLLLPGLSIHVLVAWALGFMSQKPLPKPILRCILVRLPLLPTCSICDMGSDAHSLVLGTRRGSVCKQFTSCLTCGEHPVGVSGSYYRYNYFNSILTFSPSVRVLYIFINILWSVQGLL